MVLKPEQERVRTLLVDTITLLCRNGLSYKTEFDINALIGITLDKGDIFLVDIRETIKNAAAEQEEAEEAAAAAAAKQRTESTSSKSRKRRKRTSRGGGESSDSEAETDAAGSTTSKGAEKSNCSKDTEMSKEPPNKRAIKQEMFEQLTAENEEQESNLLVVKPEPGYRQRHCDTNQQAFHSSGDSIAGPSSWDPGQQANFNPNTSSAQGLQQQQQQSQQTPFPLQQQQQAGHDDIMCTNDTYTNNKQEEEDDDVELIASSIMHDSPSLVQRAPNIAPTFPPPPLIPPPAPSPTQFAHQMAPPPTPGSSLLTNVDFLRSLGPEALLGLFKEAGDGGFTCPVCGKTIRTRAGMRPHINIHLGRYRYTCHHCAKGLSSITSLKEHLASIHGDSGWHCAVCATDFHSNKELREHMAREQCGATATAGT